MAGSEREKMIGVNDRALERLAKARKAGESFSDVILRLSEPKVASLQQRGEMDIATSDEKNLSVRIIQTRCMGAESCVVVAPQVFALDLKNLGSFHRDRKPLSMRDMAERSVDSETVVLAAKSCPYKAIYVKDIENGESLAGEPS